MNRPFYKDTSHLTEEQKCILALEQAVDRALHAEVAQGHLEHRIQELRERLWKLKKTG